MLYELDGLFVHVFITDPEFRQNAYLVRDISSGEQLIVDPGRNNKELISEARGPGSGRVNYILLTHGHFDHIGGARTIQDEFDAPALIHSKDIRLTKQATTYSASFAKDQKGWAFPSRVEPFDDYENLRVGEFKIKIHEIPGHTQGSVFIELGRFVFTGDTLLYKAIGRTDLPGGNRDSLIHFLGATIDKFERKKLLMLPGHGRGWYVSEVKLWIRSQKHATLPEFDMFRGGRESR